MWENYSVAMRAAIRIHNNIMRRQLRIVGGYEVKTEGDAFMVCFPTSTSALLWCFSVQGFLLDQDWPDEILESEGGREIQDSEGRVIYRGLSVRMGVHWGAPVCEPDPITGRMDYFGPMVNRAARICNEADGGQITVSSDFVTEVNRCVKAYQESEAGQAPPDELFGDAGTAQTIIRELRTLSSQGFEVKELGERKLKGLENPEFIYLMYPQSLAGRLQSKSAQQEAAPLPKLTVNPDDVWALYDISLRLEILCSVLNTSDYPMLKSHSMDLHAQLRDPTGENVSDKVFMPLLEHTITRIENCMAVLYVRRLLAPNPQTSNTMETAAPLFDLVDALQSKLNIQLGGATSSQSTNRMAELHASAGAFLSSPDISPTTIAPSIRSRHS